MKLRLSILAVLFLISCSNEPKKIDSFFVAGHVYGNPAANKEGKVKGLHPPFKEKLPFLREQEKLSKGYLLGDVVWKLSDWPEMLQEIEDINIPVDIVRGNHDGKLPFFEDNFGKSYRKFITNNNLHIILDSNIDGWNISGDQLDFLIETLNNDSADVDNVFIFVHHVLWYSRPKFSKPFPNSTKGRAKTTNFWSEVEPLLKKQNVPIFIFAGDVGASSKEKRKKDHIVEYYYRSDQNLTFVATGMGGGVRDNIVIADIFNDGSVKLRLIHLNGDDINGLGQFEDFVDPNIK